MVLNANSKQSRGGDEMITFSKGVLMNPIFEIYSFSFVTLVGTSLLFGLLVP